MNAPSVQVLSATPGLLSEGPRWHEERQELLWVDILGRQMHRGTLRPDGGLERVETISVDRHIGAVAPADGGGYVLAAGPGFLFIDEAGSVSELAQPEAVRTDVRMNDGACDPQGRFWAGTMAYDESPGAGALYRLELDGSCTAMLTGLTISNGIGWSPDASTMYLNDSGTGRVDAFRFDGSSGAISDRRTLVQIDRPGVAPDGLTVDCEGGIWVALWNGGAVCRYAPDGSLLATVRLPVERPTSCAFGGPGLDTLFVTSARTDLDDDALARQPHAGRLFAIGGLGVRGLPCLPYRGRTRRSPDGG
jgi:sugar lactone lactonase YvrE